MPIYRLLGGAVRRRIPIKMSVSGASPERAAELGRFAVSVGLTALKVKTGIEAQSDIVRVRAVREAVGPNFRMGIDANGGWSPRVAIQTIRKLVDDCGIYFGTTGGQVYASANSGDSWTPIVRDLPAVLSVEVQSLP